MDDYLLIQTRSLEDGKYNAAINALDSRAKIMGYFIDRKEVMHLRENISDEQLRLKIVKAAKQLEITEEEMKAVE